MMKVKEIGFVAVPVNDIARARQFYVTPECKFVEEPAETAVCHTAIIQDQDGNCLGIHRLKAN